MVIENPETARSGRPASLPRRAGRRTGSPADRAPPPHRRVPKRFGLKLVAVGQLRVKSAPRSPTGREGGRAVGRSGGQVVGWRRSDPRTAHCPWAGWRCSVRTSPVCFQAFWRPGSGSSRSTFRPPALPPSRPSARRRLSYRRISANERLGNFLAPPPPFIDASPMPVALRTSCTTHSL